MKCVGARMVYNLFTEGCMFSEDALNGLLEPYTVQYRKISNFPSLIVS